MKITGDPELLTGDPRWYNFLLGTSPVNFIFTGLDITGALSRDVFMECGVHFLPSRDERVKEELTMTPKFALMRRLKAYLGETFSSLVLFQFHAFWRSHRMRETLSRSGKHRVGFVPFFATEKDSKEETDRYSNV